MKAFLFNNISCSQISWQELYENQISPITWSYKILSTQKKKFIGQLCSTVQVDNKFTIQKKKLESIPQTGWKRYRRL
jgi:predicted nucleic-acid-binding Zn-ribbon protein